MALENYILYGKAENLFFRVYPALRRFPRSEHYALRQCIVNTFYEMLKNISIAGTVKSKRMQTLQEADGLLRSLVTMFKLANKQKYISNGFYEIISELLTEIGKILSASIRGVSQNKQLRET